MGEQARVHATVSGRVQGVGFRYFVLRKARELRLRGWVRNLGTSEVELLAEGPRSDLHQLLDAVRQGPPMSWVQNLRADWMEPKGDLAGFDLKYTV